MKSLDKDIKFVSGVGEQRAKLLEKELGITTFADMLYHFPFRYIDRTHIYSISEVEHSEVSLVQIRARVVGIRYVGEGHKKRFVAEVADSSGSAELLWFQGVKWIEKRIEVGREYLIFGRPSLFGHSLSMVHPELENIEVAFSRKALSGMQGIYSSTERLSSSLGAKGFYKIMCNLWPLAQPHIEDNLPEYLRERYKLMSLSDALFNVHFPQSADSLERARYRLKFDELLSLQLNVQSRRAERISRHNGFLFPKVGDAFNGFYSQNLPFSLTAAQKRVVKEIRQDTVSGYQMNRLLQGDVGSGKTIVHCSQC